MLTDAQKLKIVKEIVLDGCEFVPNQNRGEWYEAILTAVITVLSIDEGDKKNED